MRKSLFLTLALLGCLPLAAQEAGRIFRTEAAPYDTRHDADARNRSGASAWREFRPQPIGDTGLHAAVVEIPYAWTDGIVFMHLENTGSAYDLRVNGEAVASVEDPLTPAEFCITPYLREGKNLFEVELRDSRTPRLQEDVPLPSRPLFEGSALYSQHKRSIADFSVALVPDSTGRFGVLELDIVARNGYNYEETVTVGYDIYSPEGKLLDFNIVDVTVPGRSTDTLRFRPYIYHTYEHPWPGSKAPLYKVMLFTRREGVYKEYMPLRVGFGCTELTDGRLMRLGKELKPTQTRYNAAATREATLTELKGLKAKGFDTLRPDYPQPEWFYDLCDGLGLFVIDRASINAPMRRDDRTVGGTASNDPQLVDEYLERVRAMYYRSRNHTCVIAFELGGPSGNGYDMYKAYQWLKSVEKRRPVIYGDAAGEWNSDM